MRETATVPADGNVLKRLGAIEDYLAEKKWSEAIDVLQEIAQTDSRLLVEAQPGTAGGSKVYLNVATRCNVLLSRLPPEGLATYRRKVDPQAKRWFETWRRSRDEAELQRIVRQAYLSSSGDDALWALGEAAWDRGDFTSARLYWTQLVPLEQQVVAVNLPKEDGVFFQKPLDVAGDQKPADAVQSSPTRTANLPTVLRYPDSDLDPAAVLARLVLCSLMEGDRNRAVEEQKLFAGMSPDTQGTLAGQHGKLSELLARILDDSTTWKAEATSTDVTTFGLGPARMGVVTTAVEIGAARWSQPLTPNPLPQPARFRSSPDLGPLSTHPVVYGDIVLVNDADSIFAWNLLTGEPAWPTERGTAEIYPPVPEEHPPAPDRVCVGVPFFTMMIADGRLFARMGSPVTNTADTELRDLASDLVCLDLEDSQGKLVWKVPSHELLKEEQHPWRYEGSPLVLSGRAYVALSRRRPQLEFCIACLDAATGTLLWNRPVATARGGVDDHQNRVSHLLLTAGVGKIVLSTDAGAIIAVNATDGRLEWAVSYESDSSDSATSAANLSNPSKQGLVPAMFYEGLLFVAPNDSDRLFCIEADSGRVRWQQKHPGGERWLHLLGVVPGGIDGRLIVSGQSLWSIDVAANRILWPRTSWLGGRTVEDDPGFGHGVLVGDAIYWPTRESIKIVDAATGQTRDSKTLYRAGAPETGGNLTIADGMLLVAQPDRLVAYCEYSLLKKRLEKELSGNPANLRLLGGLTDINAASGDFDAAVATVRQALRAIDGAPVADTAGRDRWQLRLRELLRKSAQQRLSNNQATEAMPLLTEAFDLSTDPTQQVEVLVELADTELALGRPAAAVERWQQILDDPHTRDAGYLDSTGGAFATNAISRLIGERTRAVYLAVERIADRQISAALKARDVERLREALARFPNAEAKRRAERELADLELKTGHPHAAFAIYGRLARDAKSPADRGVVVAKWAAALDGCGYWRTARKLWPEVESDDFAEIKVDVDGEAVNVQDLARRRLKRPEYQSLDPTAAVRPAYLERSWSVSFPSPALSESQADRKHGEMAAARADNDARPPNRAAVRIPEGTPPADSLAIVLIHEPAMAASARSSQLKCVDRSSGAERWRIPFDVRPTFAAYGDTHLLVGTKTNLTAFTLEAGQRLWSVSFKSDADDDPVQICLRDQWVLAFDGRSGVVAIDARTGQIVWTFLPPRGRLQREWTCGENRIALQTLQPASTWLIDIAGTLQVLERLGTLEPWLQGPDIRDPESAVMMRADHRIECRSSTGNRMKWTYRGGLSFAHVDPVLWSTPNHLLLTVDGLSLVGVNRRTGRSDWSAGLAHLPLSNPIEQVASTDDAAFAASHGLLRRVSLKYGEVQWERFLGTADDQWKVAVCGALIAAWPMNARRPASHFVVWCDAQTGRIVQRLNLPDSQLPVDVSGNGRECLVVTDGGVIALRAVETSSATVTSRE